MLKKMHDQVERLTPKDIMAINALYQSKNNAPDHRFTPSPEQKNIRLIKK